MKVLRRLIESIFPPKCMLCGRVCEAGSRCCEGCMESIKRMNTESSNDRVITGRNVVVPLLYDAMSSRVIIEMKRTGDIGIAKYLGQEIAEEIRKVYPDVHFDIVTDVPMSNKKYSEFGFNHSELLSGIVSRAISVEHMPKILGRLDNSLAQHELGATERFHNANKSYYIKENVDLKGKTVLLVDDIVTTGATLKACTELLLKMGADKVYCAVAMGK